MKEYLVLMLIDWAEQSYHLKHMIWLIITSCYSASHCQASVVSVTPTRSYSITSPCNCYVTLYFQFVMISSKQVALKEIQSIWSHPIGASWLGLWVLCLIIKPVKQRLMFACFVSEWVESGASEGSIKCQVGKISIIVCRVLRTRHHMQTVRQLHCPRAL